MAQAILVKYLPPTKTKGPRLKAIAWFGSLTTAYYDYRGPTENHERAAVGLCAKYDQRCTLTWAQLPGSMGYVFIMSPL